jgi:CheY-like chemotaxis protein
MLLFKPKLMSQSDHSISPKRILVIDDEASIRFILKACLEDMAGWEVSIASSGQEGILKAKSDHPNLILLDISMPELDGIQVLKILQSDAQTASIPVIFLTAYATQVDRRKDPLPGVIRMLGKPFDPVSLIGEIADAMGWISPEASESC